MSDVVWDTILVLRFRLQIAVVALAVFSAAAPFAAAMVVTTTTLDTTQPPADNPGWNYVTVGANTRNYTYLGNGWALSAWHVGPFIGVPENLQHLTFSTGVVSVIPNQNYDVTNPTSFPPGDPNNPPISGLSTYTDLKLVRIDTDLELSPLTIAGPTPLPSSIVGTSAAEVTIIGNGRTRVMSQSTFGGTHQGYLTTADRTKRWGKKPN